MRKSFFYLALLVVVLCAAPVVAQEASLQIVEFHSKTEYSATDKGFVEGQKYKGSYMLMADGQSQPFNPDEKVELVLAGGNPDIFPFLPTVVITIPPGATKFKKNNTFTSVTTNPDETLVEVLLNVDGQSYKLNPGMSDLRVRFRNDLTTGLIRFDLSWARAVSPPGEGSPTGGVTPPDAHPIPTALALWLTVREAVIPPDAITGFARLTDVQGHYGP